MSGKNETLFPLSSSTIKRSFRLQGTKSYLMQRFTQKYIVRVIGPIYSCYTYTFKQVTYTSPPKRGSMNMPCGLYCQEWTTCRHICHSNRNLYCRCSLLRSRTTAYKFTWPKAYHTETHIDIYIIYMYIYVYSPNLQEQYARTNIHSKYHW